MKFFIRVTCIRECHQCVCMFVCLSVCESVCESVRSRISKTSSPNFIKFSLHVTRDRGSVLLGRQCNTLCTSGFVDDVMLSRNGANGPESKTTRMSRPVRQVTASGRVCRLQLHFVRVDFTPVYSKYRHRGTCSLPQINLP